MADGTTYTPINVTIGKNTYDINPEYNNFLFPFASTWKSSIANTSNIVFGKTPGIGLLGSISGIPQISQVGQSLLNTAYDPHNSYAVKSFDVPDIPFVKYPDFRSNKTAMLNLNPNQYPAVSLRLDGTQALSRGSVLAGLYLAASTSPIGAYSVFNLDGVGKTGFGMGDHDNPYALRNDFTAMSHISTKWTPAVRIDHKFRRIRYGDWVPTTNALERVTPFRGDKVSVIDFGQRTLKEAYLWKPARITSILGQDLTKLGITQDFIKFYFTGPKLANGTAADVLDDMMVFRATINGLTDTFQPQWVPQQLIGRADPNYHYSQYGRDIQLDFTIFASSRDELKPIWRKLNALAGYTAPTYDPTSIAMQAPWLRFTIGDLFVQQPAFISSLTYTLHDDSTSWEINIEQDPTMMQVPHKINVSIGLTPVMDYLPQNGGKFYTLSREKYADNDPETQPGRKNWLSDSRTNTDRDKILKLANEAKLKAEEAAKKEFNDRKLVTGIDTSQSAFG